MLNFGQIKKTFVRQRDMAGCGVACLSSVIKFYGGQANYDEITRKCGSTKQGTSILGLYHAATEYGLNAIGYQADSIDNLQEVKVPAILHLDLPNNLKHYVVFYGFKKNKAIIGDPGKGISLWTLEDLKKKWKSQILLSLKPNEKFINCTKVASPNKLMWLTKMLSEDSNILLASLFLGVIISVLSLASAVFTQNLIDKILPSKDEDKLMMGLSLFAIVLIIKIILDFIRAKFLITQSRDFNNRIINNFFSSLLELPKNFFDSKKSGDLVSRMNDTRRIQMVISGIVGSAIIQLLTVVVVLFAIFAYSPSIGFLLIFTLPIYIIGLYLINNKVLKSQREVMSTHAANESNYIDTISGIQEIKLNNAENLFQEITLHIYKAYQHKLYQFGLIKITLSNLINFLGTITTLGVMAYSSFLVIQDVLMVGELVAIFSLSSMIIPSIGSLILSNIQIQEAFVAFERMTEFGEKKSPSGVMINPKINYDFINISNVSFFFPGTLYLLENINLKISKGKFSVLLGESGTGKSTILQLLLKFYNPSSGTITLNNQPIEKLNSKYYRNIIGVVPQNIKIFNNTCLFNIALSNDPEDIKKAKEWCDANNFSQFFLKLPQGYATYLGEDGAKLSGGQKQLLALARALHKNPQFLLIDEGTSSMDKITEGFILNKIISLKKEIGILFISHRKEVAYLADKLFLLEDGKIEDYASMNELLEDDNIYSKDYREILAIEKGTFK